MIELPVDELKPGMILAQSVRNHQGVLLLDAGTKITKKNIRIFQSWGVVEVSVAGELAESGAAGEIPVAEGKDSIEMELKEKFSDVLDDPVMIEIFKAAKKQLMKHFLKIEHEKENCRPQKNYR